MIKNIYYFYKFYLYIIKFLLNLKKKDYNYKIYIYIENTNFVNNITS